MNDTNQNQTDIFGNVTPFQTQPTEQPQPNINPYPQQGQAVFQASNVQVGQTVPVQSVKPDPVPVVEIPEEEKIKTPTVSFNEMPFAGVNQQQEESKRITILESQPTVMNVETQVDTTSNMKPIQKQEDENSGLKFLIVLGIIFAVIIILLPYIQ